ncbi:MAG: CAP domain-containing protein [Anaerolineaceae bacterium]|nr:CAP domain-containing protein [Anaerolineaceae bacterium]
MKFFKTLLSLLALLLFLPCQSAFGKGGSAYDILDRVNQLRASRGLAPYSTDSGLMAAAQAQADYMASIGQWTHTRPDGSLPYALGFKENVAMGAQLTPDFAVSTLWTDADHWDTMMAFASGSAGAGIASDGNNTYYSFVVAPGGLTNTSASQKAANPVIQAANLRPQEAAAAQPQLAANGIVTSTPNPDGSIVHIVKYGEYLYAIAQAYGLTPEEIMTNSGNSPQATDLREGDVLIIRFKFTVTPTNDFTPTPIPVTPQPTKVYLSPTPTATPTPSSTPTPTATPPLSHRVLGNNKGVGGVLMGTGLLGMAVLTYFGFLRKK